MVQTGSQLGPYRLQRRIGAGGMAEVFLAQRIGAEGFSRTVAIKTILAVGAEEEGIGLFLDEARVASYLEHAAIVQTVDLGFENETLFIVMEYVPGPALSRMIRDLKKLNQSLSPQVVAYIGARVASALDYAYSRASTPDGKVLHLVHRDISPQNILITRTGNVKLTDFGVARASVQTHRTRTGQVRGKAAYMAPEQVRAGALDGRTDLFALALVLYEALTGVRAFQRKTDIMSMRAILTDVLTPIKELNPAVPDDLIAVIAKATAKKPDDRYQTAAELGEALQKSYRMHSEAAIEAEIVTVINELFGPEQFGVGEAGVEAWQPTIAAQAAESSRGSHPTPHRISAGKLSPKIAAMLSSTPNSSPSVETPSEPFDDEMELDLGSMVSALPPKTPSGVKYANVVAAGAIAAGRNADASMPSLPGVPVFGQTAAHAPTSAHLSDAVAPFNEVLSDIPPPPVGARSTRVLAHGQQTNVRTPSNATGAISLSDPSVVRPRGRAVMWAVGAFSAALVIALSILLLTPHGQNVERPPLEAQPETQVGVVSRRAPDSEGTRPEVHEQKHTVEPIEHDVEPRETHETRDVQPRDPREGRDKRPRPKPIEPAQDKPKPEIKDPVEQPPQKADKTKERDTFLVRALSAKKTAAGDVELAKKLTSAINDVMAGRDVTNGDWELVKRAEKP